jgi:hypothetical protein
MTSVRVAGETFVEGVVFPNEAKSAQRRQREVAEVLLDIAANQPGIAAAGLVSQPEKVF